MKRILAAVVAVLLLASCNTGVDKPEGEGVVEESFSLAEESAPEPEEAAIPVPYEDIPGFEKSGGANHAVYTYTNDEKILTIHLDLLEDPVFSTDLRNAVENLDLSPLEEELTQGLEEARVQLAVLGGLSAINITGTEGDTRVLRYLLLVEDYVADITGRAPAEHAGQLQRGMDMLIESIAKGGGVDNAGGLPAEPDRESGENGEE